MSDLIERRLIERLRNVAEPGWAGISNGLCYEAADEIERLTAVLKSADVIVESHVAENAKLQAVVDAANEVIEGCDRNTLSAGQVYVDEGSLRALICRIDEMECAEQTLLMNRKHIAKLQAVVDAAACKKTPGGQHRWNGDGQCLGCTKYATDTLDTLIADLENNNE